MLPTKKTDMLNLNEGTSSIEMSIDASSSEFLMGVLTDLYQYKINAVIREYSTNAQDATKAAGNETVVEVTLPTVTDLFFTVRDYGTGMSHQEIIDVYSKYGASQSRNSNDVTGMLGLGSKSALTYTSSFTVDTVKDGVRLVATVSKTNTVPTIEILAKVDSDEPNGTTIKVPVSRNDIYEFGRVAKEIYSFWSDPILVDGEKPLPFSTEGTWTQLDESIWFNPNGHYSHVVQGNVAYPVNYRATKDKNITGSFVAFVPNGSVDFTPAREEMRDTDLTTGTIETILNYVKNSFKRLVSDSKNMSPTEILAAGHKLGWKNLPSQLTLPFSDIPVTYKEISLDDVGSGKNWIQSNMLAYKPDAFYVTGFKAQKVNKNHAERLRLHISDSELSDTDVVTVFVLPERELEGYEFKNVIKWEDVARLKRDTSGATSTVKGYDYEVMTTDGSQTVVGLVESPKIVFGHREALTIQEIRAMLAFDDELHIVPLSKNRMNKFARLHPTAITLGDWIVKANAEFIANADIDDLEVIEAHHNLNKGCWLDRNTIRGLLPLVGKVPFETKTETFLQSLNKKPINLPFFVNINDIVSDCETNFVEELANDKNIRLMARMREAGVDIEEIGAFLTWKAEKANKSK